MCHQWRWANVGEMNLEVWRRRNQQTDRQRTWLAAASGESTCRYGMDRDNIEQAFWSPLTPTGTRILFLTGLSMPRPQLCPRLRTCWTPNHKKTQPSTLPLCPIPPLTPHLPYLCSPSPFVPLYNPPNLSLPLKRSTLCFSALFHALICFAEQNCPQNRRE